LNLIHNNSLHAVLLCQLICLGCLLLPSRSDADVQKSEIPRTGSSTVEELLNLESRAALELARRQVFGGSSGTTSPSLSNDLPVLVAIYGTGRNLSAEILLGGRTVIFHGSGKQPVSGVPYGYALERIAPPCVYLTKDQTQEVVCLELRTP